MSIKRKLFKWLSDNRIIITDDNIQIDAPKNKGINMSTGQMSIGAQYSPSGIGINSAVGSVNFTVAKANGGWIVQATPINTISSAYTMPELYIIPADTDFNTEIGKIITMVSLKAQ